MKVINICHQDYANFGYLNAQAMRSVGIDATAYVLTKHSFGYKEQAKQATIDEIRKQAISADIIQVMHSCGTMHDVVKPLNKPTIVWHTGTRYRQNADKYNTLWHWAIKHVVALGEFVALNPYNPEYFGITINTDEYQEFGGFKSDILTFAHYPSNPEVKGTPIIKQVMRELQQNYPDKFLFRHSASIVPHDKQKLRMSKCHVYIEMCASHQKGKPYGSYGTTAVEVSAMGIEVITCNLWDSVYRSVYGDYPLHIANDKEKLYDICESIIIRNSEGLGSEFKKWAVENHSYKASGERMSKLLKSI